MTEPRLVEVRQNVLKQNDLLARELRERRFMKIISLAPEVL